MEEMRLESERLTFRKIEPGDFAAVAEIMRGRGVQKVWGHFFTDQDVREWIEKRRRGYEAHGIDYLLACRRDSSEAVGQIGLLRETIQGREVWAVGYILADRYCGRGYATEGARAMAEYAFRTLKAPEIFCDIRPENLPSLAVAKRLGMTETGSFLKRYRGQDMPHLIFRLRPPAGGLFLSAEKL